MIVGRVTSNSAMVGGVFIQRPGSMSSCDWREFWEPAWCGSYPPTNPFDRRLAKLINFDAFRAMVFGAIIPKPPSVTQFEWETFWQARSNRAHLSDTNRMAENAYDSVYIRQRERTARKPS